MRPHEGGCEREIRQRTPCIGERNSRAPPIKRRRGKRKEEGREGGGDGREGGRGGRGGGDGGGDGLDTHFQSLFVVTDPSAPESTVDSYLVVPIFMIFHCTAPHLALEFIPRRTWSKRAPRVHSFVCSRSRITICDTLTADADFTAQPIPSAVISFYDGTLIGD